MNIQILMIDQGNTRNKYAKWAVNESIQLIEESTLVEGYFDYVLIASVKKDALLLPFAEQFVKNKQNVIQVMTQKSANGLMIAYEDPTRLGVDRWLAMLGAYQVNEQSLVIDSGTALTIDAINTLGQHLGGWIIPGLKTSEKALLAKTDSIHMQKKLTNSIQFGLNTEECVKNGILLSLLLPIKQAVELMEIPNKKLKCYFTGGDGPLLGLHMKKIIDDKIEVIIDPTLLFKGLVRYFIQEVYDK
ncbi:type III pantothenate kinase [Algibacillus agarilyticus]|uniref:type III pantothenate kinase n=1 Tax=Algibacillus agarilyticus TaxID=2234133 RepID=UPI001300776E|nr:type III pantothenate kinase [Algibacillus agarilyticus]